MLRASILLNNLFRTKDITPKRLYNFGVVVLKALILANDSKQFDTIIASLTAALAALKKEISDVDVNLNSQKTETETVDDFIVTFYRFMSENEPFIARQLGGRSTAGYKEMYPFGLTEYSNATKTEMPMLTLRVKTVTEKYIGKLEPELSGQLQAFDGKYEMLYSAQQTQIQTVKSDMTERKTAFETLQLVLTQTVYSVGLQYPGNVEKCASFFPFAMLYAHRNRESLTVEGALEKEGVATLLNRQLLKSAVVTVNNTGVNASFAVWMATSPDEPMPADATVVSAAGNTVTLEASIFGDLETNVFFMVQNLSNINNCSYEVTFTGLKKKKKEKVVKEKVAPMKVATA